jgi:hypothetical protein
MDFTKKVKAKVYCLDPGLYKDQIITGYLQPNGELLVNYSIFYKEGEFEVILTDMT